MAFIYKRSVHGLNYRVSLAVIYDPIYSWFAHLVTKAVDQFPILGLSWFHTLPNWAVVGGWGTVITECWGKVGDGNSHDERGTQVLVSWRLGFKELFKERSIN